MATITLRWGVVLEDATVGVAGETYTVSDGFAAGLIARGRAVIASEPVSEAVPAVDGRKAEKRTR